MPRREALSTIAIALVETGALQFGRFTLSSGKTSSYYIDLRRIPSFPKAYKKVVRAYRLLVKEVGAENFDAVAGIATSGLTFSSPLAISIAKPMVYVRQEKSHGTKKRLEGVLPRGSTTLVVDDLITTGGNIVYAVESLRAEGSSVRDAIVLIDRLEGGKENLEKVGVRLHRFSTVLELSQVLYEKAIIKKAQLRAVNQQVRRAHPL
ncbi:MAG TPA: orotate phosphoribosyltransferase [Nitrososphaerales archaeon]|nr:orotate phosphoribosyltransferase [Nitrososphaerales archaeon]